MNDHNDTDSEGVSCENLLDELRRMRDDTTHAALRGVPQPACPVPEKQMKTAKMKVEYIDHLGTDLTVVNAARVSFDKASQWETGFKMSDDDCDVHYGEPCRLEYTKLSDADVKLIAYLAKHNHWSPFAHTSIQLRVKAPIFVARQLVKHQVGGVWNEVSRRYVDSEPEFYFPEVWRGRPTDGAKQGSSGVVDRMDGYGGESSVQAYAHTTVSDYLSVYSDMIAAGVAPEQARMILPQNTMTEWIWTGSLMFFARVCAQRLEPHAQAETSEVARQIAETVRPLFPMSWAALTAKEGV